MADSEKELGGRVSSQPGQPARAKPPDPGAGPTGRGKPLASSLSGRAGGLQG